jgi:hypothetical protein
MKIVLDKALSEFFKTYDGKNSLKSIKSYIFNHKLYGYKLPNYYQHINTEELKALVSIPCPTYQGDLDSQQIKVSKMLRNALDVQEKIACNQCVKKNVCRQSFIPSRVTPTVADYVRFIYSVSQDPPKDDILVKSVCNHLSALDSFITNIDKYPVPLKAIEIPGNDKNAPIEASVVKDKPKIKIPKKFLWKPKEQDFEKLKKLEARKERQGIKKELNFIARDLSNSSNKNRRINRPEFEKNKKYEAREDRPGFNKQNGFIPRDLKNFTDKDKRTKRPEFKKQKAYEAEKERQAFDKQDDFTPRDSQNFSEKRRAKRPDFEKQKGYEAGKERQAFDTQEDFTSRDSRNFSEKRRAKRPDFEKQKEYEAGKERQAFDTQEDFTPRDSRNFSEKRRAKRPDFEKKKGYEARQDRQGLKKEDDFTARDLKSFSEASKK